MNSVRKAVIKLFCASMIVLALLLTEYGFVQDSAFRRQLIIMGLREKLWVKIGHFSIKEPEACK
jgi:hypothetical protein